MGQKGGGARPQDPLGPLLVYNTAVGEYKRKALHVVGFDVACHHKYRSERAYIVKPLSARQKLAEVPSTCHRLIMYRCNIGLM